MQGGLRDIYFNRGLRNTPRRHLRLTALCLVVTLLGAVILIGFRTTPALAALALVAGAPAVLGAALLVIGIIAGTLAGWR